MTGGGHPPCQEVRGSAGILYLPHANLKNFSKKISKKNFKKFLVGKIAKNTDIYQTFNPENIVNLRKKPTKILLYT